MNYEGKSVLSGGGAVDPQTQMNTEDIKINRSAIIANTTATGVSRQLGYIAAFQLIPGMPATGTTELINEPRRFYNGGYAPDLALMNRTSYAGQRVIVMKTLLVPDGPLESPFGLRWIPVGEASAVFRIRVRVTLLSRTDTPVSVFLRVEQRDKDTRIVAFEDIKRMEYNQFPVTQTFRYELDIVTEINIDPAAILVDFTAFGRATRPGQYTFEYVLDSDKDNSIDVQRLV